MGKKIGYKGFLADGDQDRIKLSTKDGKRGYRIVKMNLFAAKPGAASQESVVKIYKKEQTSVDGLVDFTDNALIGTGYLLNHLTATDNPAYMYTVFDNEVFNQDIYITHSEVKNAEDVNYYLELETIDLSDSESTQITLKNLRTVASRFT